MNSPNCQSHHSSKRDCLLDEKATIEKRLHQLGYDGDCAYEKALVSFYSNRLEECNRQLELDS